MGPSVGPSVLGKLRNTAIGFYIKVPMFLQNIFPLYHLMSTPSLHFTFQDATTCTAGGRMDGSRPVNVMTFDA